MSEIKARRAAGRDLSKAAAMAPEMVTEAADISPIALAAAENAAAIAETAETAAHAVAAEVEAAAPSEPQAHAQAQAETAAAAAPARETAEKFSAFGGEAMAAFAETQAAIARGLEAFAAEVNGLARSSFAATADSATALLGAKTLADAIDVQAGFARRSVDAVIDGSAKLSEIGVRLTTEATRPWLSRTGQSWT